jgi:acetoacetate decarboxylase
MKSLDRTQRYEMPVTFGPVPLAHIRYGDVTSVSIPYTTKARDEYAALLPPALELPDETIVTVTHQRIADVSFLAGREYAIVSVSLNAIFKDDQESIFGGYGAILWENDVYSIIVGREPFGAPKLYADISDLRKDGEEWSVECSEFGTPLVSGYFQGMKELEQAEVETMTTQGGRPKVNFRYKHIPRATGGADVSYLMRGNNFKSTVDRAWTGAGRHHFYEVSKDTAPVSYRVVSRLRLLTVDEYLPAVASHGTTDIEQGTGYPLALRKPVDATISK